MRLPDREHISSIITDYYQISQKKVNLGEYQLYVSLKAYQTDMILSDPIVDLFIKSINSNPLMIPHRNLLILGSGNGLLAAYLAKRIPELNIWATDSTTTSVNLTYQTALANNLETIRVFPESNNPDSYFLTLETHKYDTVIVILPKGRNVARRWLFDAYRSLAYNGILYLAGANNEGVQSIAKDAIDLFGKPNILGYKKGNRLYRFTKNHSLNEFPKWAFEPGIFPGTWKEFNAIVNNNTYNLRTLPGVFAYDHIDGGTRMLLEWMCVPPDANLLDIGCGCGIIGLHAAKIGV